LTQFKLQWESAVGSLERFQSPEHVRKFITDVQRENHMLIESKGRAETELKAIQIQFIDKEKIVSYSCKTVLPNLENANVNADHRTS
jgi:hypothetical protein